MSESDDNSRQTNRKGDQWVDAIAAVVLIAIVVATFAYWASTQS